MGRVNKMKIGERISGRYKIIKKIGSGGMANVYLAEDLILDREVAVKMLSLNFQEDEAKDNLRRFQREALSTTELTHPNIVNIYDVGDGDRPYIVMEFVDGTDLKKYIQENHPIPYNKVIKIMVQILSGISNAHANGIIHRDIKPHNILIDHEGTVKITDFGIAVALSQNSITQTNSILGSVQYMSPEQARGNLVTKQSDVYSLGIVLYEMLTGTVPFEGESAVSVALKHFQAPIPSLREFDSRVPQPLENVVLKATAKEPKNRYASVNEMLLDLETALDPNRRDEAIFIPADINQEETLVMKEPLIPVGKDNVEDMSTAVISDQPLTPTEKKKEEKKKRPWWLLIFPVILIAIFLFWVLGRPQEVEIPEELIGLSLDEAVELLVENNLVLGETIERSNEEVEAGIVFQTSPGTGGVVREGAEIDLYVSIGEKPYVIKDYTGENYEEVRAKLSELGFTVESETINDETAPAGSIIEQDINPETEVKISETTINFVVSGGREEIKLIDFEGYTQPGVKDYTEVNNLELEVTAESSEEIPAGIVISQSPEAGETVYAGDTISVVFSTGPEEIELINFTVDITIPFQERTVEEPVEGEEGEESTETPTLPPAQTNYVEIFIGDHNHELDGEPVHTFSMLHSMGYTLKFTVEEGKTATYRIDIDGETVVTEVVRP